MSRTVDPEILLGFLEEASGYLPAIRSGLAAVRGNPADLSAAEEAHRGIHTIKGAAAMVGLAGLSHIAHHLEEAVDDLMQGRLSPDPQIFPVFERTVEQIEKYLECSLDESFDDEPLVSEAVEGLRALRGLPAPASIATGAALGGGPGWVLPFESTEPTDDDTIDELAGLGLPFGDSGTDTTEIAAPPFAPPAVEISSELLEVFKLEADDHLRTLTTLLPATKSNPSDREQWSEIRRAAHTLKGTAAMVGFADVTKLAHRMEDLLDQYFEGTRVARAEEIDLLLAGTDAIEDTINGRSVAYEPLFARLDSALAQVTPGQPVEEQKPAPVPVVPAEITDDEPVAKSEPSSTRKVASEAYVRIPIERLDDIVKLVGELVIARTAFEARMGDFQRLLGELDPSTNRIRRAAAKLETDFEASALAQTATGTGGDGFDALEFDRYTEFHLVSRELAETTNDIQTLTGELNHVHGDCDGFLTRQARLASELEDKLMRLRMVPLSTQATKLQRTVRNAASQTRKKAELVLEGERTGLDKTVLEAMADPLLHLLRNAVDHGLESPEVRRALGKPDQGTIRLSALHEGNQVVLSISDDGRGIDPNAVREIAYARGFLDAHERTLEEVYALLFEPGFSTKGEVSELSGRGVGLDVVKSKVESLKGTVTVSSRPGQGTTFTIRLPLTLAITRALLVRTHGQTFAIPLDCVEQILRFEESDVQRIGRDPVLAVGDATYPVSQLGRVLDLKTPADEAVKRPPVLLIRSGEKRLALVVERLVGGREIVIKNLGPHLRKVSSVTGATLLGDGSVVLILNPADLLKAAALRTSTTMSQLLPRPSIPRSRAGTTVLLVDDSPSVRRVLTGLVERQGWKPIAAKDGVEALEILRRGPNPDIVLSDVEMPRMDGFELLGSIRGQTATARLPVVMITSRAAEKHRRKAMELGASAYVTKPYQDESLLDVIRHLTRSHA